MASLWYTLDDEGTVLAHDAVFDQYLVNIYRERGPEPVARIMLAQLIGQPMTERIMRIVMDEHERQTHAS